LGGVLVEFTENGITAVATDGRRLAKQEGPATSVGGHHESDKMTIIPSRAMTLIERAIAGSEENIQISARDNDLLLRVGKSTIYTRLVEGRFPKWRDVFPRREGTTLVDMTVGPFYAAVRQAAIVTSDEHRGVDFIFGEGKLNLSGHGAEMGESHIEMPIAYDGEEIAVMLDPRYLSDFLRVLDPESTITVAIRDSESAVVCSTADGYANVIMPLARDRR
jgi:DNA polymerase-3 subunit beta